MNFYFDMAFDVFMYSFGCLHLFTKLAFVEDMLFPLPRRRDWGWNQPCLLTA